MPDEKTTGAKAKKDDAAAKPSPEEAANETSEPQAASEDAGATPSGAASLTPFEEQLREREQLQRLRRELYRKYHGKPLR